MPQLLMQIIVILSWLALPVGVLCIADDWFLRPRRQILAAPQEARDPPMIALAYHALPVLIGAAVLRLLVAERLDFSAVLLGITVLTGVVSTTVGTTWPVVVKATPSLGPPDTGPAGFTKPSVMSTAVPTASAFCLSFVTTDAAPVAICSTALRSLRPEKT